MSKPIAAIVESDADTAIAAVRACASSLRESEVQLEKQTKKVDAIRSATEGRRLELGRALVRARALWPAKSAAQGGAKGPGGRTWGAFLEAEGISESSAWRYMSLAGYVDRPDAPDQSFQGERTVPTYAEAGVGKRESKPSDDDWDPAPSRPVARPRDGFDVKLGEWSAVLTGVGMVDALITDPPYGARTHESELRDRADGVDVSGLRPDYECWTPADVAAFVSAWSPRVRGWMVALTSHDLCPAWEAAYLAAGRYPFAPVPCVITGMTVRMRGDGPSSWTVYAMVARPRTKDFYSWGTLPGAYVGGRQPGAENGRGKPLWLTDALVGHYSRPGDLVCDPLAGYGTTLISALDLGRRAIGAERDHGAYDEAFRRAAVPREVDPGGLVPPDAR